MTACNSDKCHCPDCIEARREREQNNRIGSLETRVEELEHRVREKRARMMISPPMRISYPRLRERTPEEQHEAIERAKALRAAANIADYERERDNRVIHTPGAKAVRRGACGIVYQGFHGRLDVQWHWMQTGPDRWRRWANEPRVLPLGEPVYRRYFTPDGNPMKNAPYASGGTVHGIPAGEGVIGTKIVEGHKPRSWTQSNPNSAEGWLHDKFLEEAKESTMSPTALSILFYVQAHGVFPTDTNIGKECGDAVLYLRQSELITDAVFGPALTERGKVYAAAVKALPLPVREPAPWVMPKA